MHSHNHAETFCHKLTRQNEMKWFHHLRLFSPPSLSVTEEGGADAALPHRLGRRQPLRPS